MPSTCPLRLAAVLALGGALTACASSGGAPPAPTAVQAVVATSPCTDMTFPIYFEKGSAELTQPARALLGETASGARRCTVSEVLVLGLADADGAENRNLELSRRRAERVASALAAEGLPAPSFDLEAAGEAGALTPGGRPEPLRRRAEVVIRLTPAQAS